MNSDQVKEEKSDGNAINEYVNMNSKPVEIRYFLIVSTVLKAII